MDFSNASNIYTPSERLLLVRRYLLENASKECVVSITDIKSHLKGLNIDVSPRMLCIDIHKLQFTENLNIVYDEVKHGYYVANPAFEPHELRLMVDSIQGSKFITQSQAQKITQKIKGLTDRHTAGTLNRQSYVENRVRSMNESVVRGADNIHACIANDEKVQFKYFHIIGADRRKEYSNKGKSVVVSPYALLWSGGFYYLYAYAKGKFRHYRVDRMERIMRYPEKREGKEAFAEKDLTVRQTKVFNMFSGKEYTVRLRCQNRMAEAILDRFGNDVILVPDGDTHFTVSVPIEVSPQFYSWVASLGRSIKITQPPEVVQEMKKYLHGIAEMYNDE